MIVTRSLMALLLGLTLLGRAVGQMPSVQRPPREEPPAPPLWQSPPPEPRPAPHTPGPPGLQPEAPREGGYGYGFRDLQRPRRLREFSYLYMEPPKPREIKVHDIITIVVNEKSQTTVNSRFDRQRNAALRAELREFVRLSKTGRLENAASNQPKVDTNLISRMQTFGMMNDMEGMTYRIAATVVDVLPNGNVVLEARKSIRSNRDVWEFSLTGVLRSEDINRDNTAFSEDVANLEIIKRQRGKVYDSTKRPWGILLYDLLSPF